mmetsp:Transcript_25708/g.58479  ORF Transcript_25708/g.58479 Transcript_25708/m.58479 type:complete len:140 (+) Transcript_25708:86-505(+)
MRVERDVSRRVITSQFTLEPSPGGLDTVLGNREHITHISSVQLVHAPRAASVGTKEAHYGSSCDGILVQHRPKRVKIHIHGSLGKASGGLVGRKGGSQELVVSIHRHKFDAIEQVDDARFETEVCGATHKPASTEFPGI